jgi:hypothetical protein
MDTQNLLGKEEIPAVTPTSDERTMAILSHVLCFVGGFIAPLVIYLIKKDESVYVREHAKESLNFQITLFILYIGCWVLAFILIGFLLMAILVIGALILIIMATIKASENKMYRYPINFRLIK